ncbi:MAG: hypothetical protein FWG68_00270 [Defluviitaleaceae bacterium]|nr:hypothetical protein [Defluviitaleaceae bacterium]
MRTHGIDVLTLRADDFNGFFGLRAKFLVGLIGQAMGKKIAKKKLLKFLGFRWSEVDFLEKAAFVRLF